MRWVSLALLLTACIPETVDDPGDVRVVQFATSSAQEGWAVNYPKQRKLLYASGRLWIFYADGQDMLVRSTTDGVTVSGPALVRSGMVFGHRCAFAWDGGRFHSACSMALPSADVFYRRGTPDAGGAIAWEDEQIAFDVPDGQSVLYPKILVDALGQPWVAFMLFEGGFETAPQSAMVTRSSRTGGVWQTSTGFPLKLTTSTATFPDPLGVALTGGASYWIYDLDGDATYRGRAWYPGSGWQPEEEVSGGRERHGLYNAVAQGDEIDVVYGGGVVHHRRRAADGSWSAETLITQQGSGHTTIAALGQGRTRISWLDTSGQRVVSRDMGPDGPGGRELLLDAGAQGGLSGRLSINLNGMAAPAGPFREALAVTVGAGPPYRLLLMTR